MRVCLTCIERVYITHLLLTGTWDYRAKNLESQAHLLTAAELKKRGITRYDAEMIISQGLSLPDPKVLVDREMALNTDKHPSELNHNRSNPVRRTRNGPQRVLSHSGADGKDPLSQLGPVQKEECGAMNSYVGRNLKRKGKQVFSKTKTKRKSRTTIAECDSQSTENDSYLESVANVKDEIFSMQSGEPVINMNYVKRKPSSHRLQSPKVSRYSGVTVKLEPGVEQQGSKTMYDPFDIQSLDDNNDFQFVGRFSPSRNLCRAQFSTCQDRNNSNVMGSDCKEDQSFKMPPPLEPISPVPSTNGLSRPYTPKSKKCQLPTSPLRQSPRLRGLRPDGKSVYSDLLSKHSGDGSENVCNNKNVEMRGDYEEDDEMPVLVKQKIDSNHNIQQSSPINDYNPSDLFAVSLSPHPRHRLHPAFEDSSKRNGANGSDSGSNHSLPMPSIDLAGSGSCSPIHCDSFYNYCPRKTVPRVTIRMKRDPILEQQLANQTSSSVFFKWDDDCDNDANANHSVKTYSCNSKKILRSDTHTEDRVGKRPRSSTDINNYRPKRLRLKFGKNAVDMIDINIPPCQELL